MWDKILSGNLDEQVLLHPETKGWFLGPFMDKYPDFKTDGLELKWARHKKGEIKPGFLADAATKTIVILMQGAFAIRFPDIEKEVMLSELGDYIFYDSSYKRHEGEAIEDCLMLVVRWPSEKSDVERII